VTPWRDSGEEVEPVEDNNQPAQPADACPDCHALVADLEAHSRWHSRLVADLANAVEDEIKRASARS
jgi:hypothetical protein